MVVGWTDPEGSRPWLGALLLAYYDPDNRLIYAGRAGTGIDYAELERLWRRLQPLAISKPVSVIFDREYPRRLRRAILATYKAASAPPDQGAGQLNALLGVRNLVLRRVVRLNNRSWLRRHVAPGGLLTPFLAQP